MTAIAETVAPTVRPTRGGQWGEYSICAGFAWRDAWIFGRVTWAMPAGIWMFVAGPLRLSVTWPLALAD